MPKYKVGDILKKRDYQRKILGICGEIIFLSEINKFDESSLFWTEKDIIFNEYTLAQSARWVPGKGERYEFVNSDGVTDATNWYSDQTDLYRLSIGNVFQVGDHIGIEAFKRRLQEGKI